MKKIKLDIQSFSRGEYGENENEQDYEVEITKDNFEQIIKKATNWVNKREFRGDLSGLLGIVENGILDNKNSFTFENADEFRDIINKIPDLLKIL
jgi:hypothetical protein